VAKSERITPKSQELLKEGIDAFLVPVDTYYGLRNFEPLIDLTQMSLSTKVPIVSSVMSGSHVPGVVLFVAPDFFIVGALAGENAVKILKDGVKPESLPVKRQLELKPMINFEIAQKIGLEIPSVLIQVVKDFNETKPVK
jgi:putative tryptophan/tyrosine transport system substrate-binding protein